MLQERRHTAKVVFAVINIEKTRACYAAFTLDSKPALRFLHFSAERGDR
jgi:hypothetical protein